MCYITAVTAMALSIDATDPYGCKFRSLYLILSYLLSLKFLQSVWISFSSSSTSRIIIRDLSRPHAALLTTLLYRGKEEREASFMFERVTLANLAFRLFLKDFVFRRLFPIPFGRATIKEKCEIFSSSRVEIFVG